MESKEVGRKFVRIARYGVAWFGYPLICGGDVCNSLVDVGVGVVMAVLKGNVRENMVSKDRMG